MPPTIDQLNDSIQDLTNDIQALNVCLEHAYDAAFSTFNDDYGDGYNDDCNGYEFDEDFFGDFDYENHNNGYDNYDSDADYYDFDDDSDYYFDHNYDDDDDFKDFPFSGLDPLPENSLANALHQNPIKH